MSEVIFYLPLKVIKENWSLNNGKEFPVVTFGVTHMDEFEKVFNAVDCALANGYKSFDCSPKNNGEEYLGRALEELLPRYNLERKDIVITSKILPKDYGPGQASEAFMRSCENLKTNYIDLFLMQWPGGHNLDPESEENQYLRQETWKEIVSLNSQGVIRSAGVCHFNRNHLESIRACSNKFPAVNQVEFHPKCPQVELLNYCMENGIQMQAASFRDTFNPLLLKDKAVKVVAKRVGRSPAQIILKWIINKGVAVIPQSEIPKKIEENCKLFDFLLEKSDMEILNAIETREKYIRSPICVV